MKKLFTIFLFILFLNNSSILAQSSLQINSLPPFEAEQYIAPLATYFGTFFNTGTYFSADVPFTFGFKFSVVGTWSIVPDNQKIFQPNPQVNIVDGTSVEPSATVFGNKGSYFLSDKGYVVYPTGFALKAVPMGIVQIAGSAFNTELMLRFFPNTNFEDAKVGLFGIGIKHEISTYFQWPLDVSVQFLYNTINGEYQGEDIEDYGKITSNNYAFNIHASKKFMDMLIAYGGIQFESSKMDVEYYFKDPNELYPNYIGINSFTLDGENKFRFTLGGAIELGAFVFNADMNFSKFTTYSIGLNLDF